jgi:putative FmdB family regulatory protein
MPIYEYYCRDCHTKYDKLRPMVEADAPVSCPECNMQNSVRALSVVIMHTGGSSSVLSSSGHSHGGCACGGACGCAGSASKN